MVDTLREMEGWGGVEERRRARADKQVDSGVVGWAEGKAWDQGGGGATPIKKGGIFSVFEVGGPE